MMYDSTLDRSIMVIFCKNPSGNVEEQLAQAILKQCKYLRQSASKLFKTELRDDEAIAFQTRENILKQYVNHPNKYASLADKVEKPYANIRDVIRKDLVLATFPALGCPDGFPPNPFQIKKDLEESLVRQAKWLRNGKNVRTIPDKKSWQYWQREADTVESFRVIVETDSFKFDTSDVIETHLANRGRKTPWVEYPFALV